jgi:protease I
MADELHGLRVAFLVANEGIEQVELTTPWQAVKAAGGEPVLIAPEAGTAQAFDHLETADTFDVDETTERAVAGEFDATVLPGGVANPDQLRLDQAALNFLEATFAAGKPAAVICHGPWTLVEAGLVKGRTLTSWPSLKTDIQNAGGTWVDEEVQVCGAGPNRLVTSRKPADLDAFCRAMVHVFAESVAGVATD